MCVRDKPRYQNIVCMDCYKVLAKVKTLYAHTNETSTSLCYPCALKRWEQKGAKDE